MGTQHYDDVISLVKAGVSDGTIDGQRGCHRWLISRGLPLILGCYAPRFPLQSSSLWRWSDGLGHDVDDLGGPFLRSRIGRWCTLVVGCIFYRSETREPHLARAKRDDARTHSSRGRVPVTQAVSFHRGCLHHGISCEVVIYPLEGHMSKGP